MATTTEAPWTVGSELADFVRRTEEPLLRAAVLVVDDPERAADLVEDALVEVGRRWPQVADERPELDARRHLYRAAVSESERPAPRGSDERTPVASGVRAAGDWAASPPSPEDVRQREQVAHALGALTPRQRAVLSLLAGDGVTVSEAARTLRVRPGTVRSEGREAVDRLARELPRQHLDGRVDGPVVRWVLGVAAQDLAAPDLAERVCERARRGRRAVRRRTALVAGGVAAAGAAGLLVPRWVAGGSGSVVDARLASVDLGGTLVYTAPGPAAEGSLPVHPERHALPVPDPIGPGDPSRVRPLPGGGAPDPVEAFYLVHDGLTRYVPVLRVPGDPPVRWEVASMHIGGVNAYLPPGPGAVAADRHRLVLPDPAGIVVVDARAGEVLEVGVPDPTLRSAGWALDQRTVVAQGRDDAWVVDLRAREATRAASGAAPGWHQLVWAAGATRRHGLAPDGTVAATDEVPGPGVIPVGPSASTQDGWVAAAAFLPGRYQDDLGVSQGVVALRADGSPARVLAERVAGATSALRYRVLGWADEATLLVESRAPGGDGGRPVQRVLAWDVLGEMLWQVGTLDSAGGWDSWFTGEWGL